MTGRPKVWLVLVCAVAVMFVASAEAMHFHPDLFVSHSSNKSKTSCLICHGPQTPGTSASAIVIGAVLTFQGTALSLVFQSNSAYRIFDLYVRPPPSC
jgi:hypothetical protein